MSLKIAYHEAGHTIVNLYLFPEDTLDSISIQPNTESSGRVIFTRGVPVIDYCYLLEIYGYLTASIIQLLTRDAATYLLDKQSSDRDIPRNFIVRQGDTNKGLGKIILFAKKSLWSGGREFERLRNIVQTLYSNHTYCCRIVESCCQPG